MRQFTDEEMNELLGTAIWLNSFFQDGIVSWSIWTKEYMSEAEEKMFKLIHIIDPTLPTREQLAEECFKHIEEESKTLNKQPLLDIFLDDEYWKTGGGLGGLE